MDKENSNTDNINTSNNASNNKISSSPPPNAAHGEETSALPTVANLTSNVNGLVNSVSSMASSSNANGASAPTTSMLSIKVHIVDANVTKTLQFNPATLVYDALKIIREKVPETNKETGIYFNFNFKTTETRRRRRKNYQTKIKLDSMQLNEEGKKFRFEKKLLQLKL